ncbi:MAG: ACP S-malonyltransferase [Thermodesulfobacteriota bacterium]
MADSEALKLSSLALIFPGQGSQYPGMTVDLARESSTARQIIERADQILGYSLSRIMAENPGNELNRTVHTQPAVFVHSMAVYEVLRERLPIRAVVAAGHSLGEISALCAAGILDFETALHVVKVRAAAMDDAQPPGTCGMAAIVGLSAQRVRELVEMHRMGDVLEAANFNAPDQIVVSGTLRAVTRLMDAASKERRCRAVTLPVSSAFHTELMAPATGPLRECLTASSFGSGRFPVVANVNGQVYPSAPAEMRRVLVDQIVSPVLWEDCVATMCKLGAESFLEVGPGRVLSGLAKRIDRNLKCRSVFDVESIRSLEEGAT